MTGLDTNCRWVRITKGKSEVAQDYEMGQDVTVHIKGSVVKVEDTDNHDGTIDKTYVVKAETILVE